MHRQSIKHLLMALATTAVAACSNEQGEIRYPGDGAQQVLLTASQANVAEGEVTRAADGLYTSATGFDGSEQVEVYLNSTASHATYTVGNVTSGVIRELTGGPLYYPTTGSITLFAVYPAASTASHTVLYDQSSDANYKASDLMFATQSVTNTISNKQVAQNLVFDHQLVKLKLSIVKSANVANVTKVEMQNVKRKVTVAPSTTALTLSSLASATGETGDGANEDKILLYSDATGITSTTATVMCCVFPDQDWNDENFITVTADGQTANFKLTKNDFAPGYEYSLTLNINAASLTATTTINDWQIAATPINGTMKVNASFYVTGASDDQEYTGTPITFPSIVVNYGSTILTEGTHYDLYYSDNNIPGTASIVAVGKGIYAGITGNTSFTILPKTVANVTTASYIGWVITSDGYIYHNGATAERAGKTPKAMIAYVGANGESSPHNHGLAIALSDDAPQIWSPATDLNGVPNKTTITEAIADKAGISNTNAIAAYTNSGGYNAKNHDALIDNCSQWFLAAQGQWVLVLNQYGAGINDSNAQMGNYSTTPAVAVSVLTALNNQLEAAGGPSAELLDKVGYWSSTERYANLAYRVVLNSALGIYVGNSTKTNGTSNVRAFLAF